MVLNNTKGSLSLFALSIMFLSFFTAHGSKDRPGVTSTGCGLLKKVQNEVNGDVAAAILVLSDTFSELIAQCPGAVNTHQNMKKHIDALKRSVARNAYQKLMRIPGQDSISAADYAVNLFLSALESQLNTSQSYHVFFSCPDALEKDSYKGSPLAFAYNANSEKLLKEFLMAGACPAHAIENLTPLTRRSLSQLLAKHVYIIGKGQAYLKNVPSDKKALMEMLKPTKELVDARNNAMNRAINQNNPRAAIFLKEYCDADINQTTPNGSSMLSLYCSYEHFFAREYFASAIKKDNGFDGMTLAVVKRLLAAGCDPLKNAMISIYSPQSKTTECAMATPYDYLKKISKDHEIEESSRNIASRLVSCIENTNQRLIAYGAQNEKVLTDLRIVLGR